MFIDQMFPDRLRFYTELPFGVPCGPWTIGLIIGIIIAASLIERGANNPIIILPLLLFSWVFAKLWMLIRRFFIFLKLLWKEIASIDYSSFLEFIGKGFLVILILSIVALTIFIIIRGINNNA